MNELSSLFADARDDSVILLQKDKTYHVCRHDSYHLDGYFCTNTASQQENPTGERFLQSPNGNYHIRLEYLKEAEITDNLFEGDYTLHTKVCDHITDSNNTVIKNQTTNETKNPRTF